MKRYAADRVVQIMNRHEAGLAARECEGVQTAIISITDIGSAPNALRAQSWIAGVLRLQFQDVTEGEPGCITRTQARQIADFVLKHRRRARRFIIHCEFGQSRSAGVAAAISRYLNGDATTIMRSRKYAPNPTCAKYVLKALRRRGRLPGFLRQWRTT